MSVSVAQVLILQIKRESQLSNTASIKETHIRERKEGRNENERQVKEYSGRLC